MLKVFSEAWISDDVLRIAEVIATAEDFGDGCRDFPVLADALEDAGCDDPELLFILRCNGTSDVRIWHIWWFILHPNGTDREMARRGYCLNDNGLYGS